MFSLMSRCECCTAENAHECSYADNANKQWLVVNGLFDSCVLVINYIYLTNLYYLMNGSLLLFI